MNAEQQSFRPVKVLPPDTARKIAAGEVIDRPNAVLREFLDNAVDAGASRIIAEIEGGGTESIRVVDNGWGMSRDDLSACARPHATSKIRTEADLSDFSTLGFRGEALASIAAVSRLELISSRSGDAWHLEVALEGEHFIEPASLDQGTIALSRGLFANFPARHQFLKRAQTEAAMCKQTFIEKALPFPHIAFRLLIDGKIRLDLSANQSFKERFAFGLEMEKSIPLFYEISADALSENSAEVRLVLGEPSLYRSDRKFMYIFVNGRRVQEFSLLQAIDYGAEGYFPNGTHPIAALFLNINPALADFNIHPAKKEVRFKDIAPIHRMVSSSVRNFFRDLTLQSLVKNEKTKSPQYETSDLSGLFELGEKSPKYAGSKNHSGAYTAQTGSASFPAAQRSKTASAWPQFSAPRPQDFTALPLTSFKYIGAALGVFLIAEKNDELYLIDQHAGHERILFDRFIETAGQKQELLIPLVLETPSPEDDTYLENLGPALQKAGFTMTNQGEGRWEVSAVPIKWQGGEADLQSDLLDKHLNPEEILRSLASATACRAAIKDGHLLDNSSAEDLLQKIFSLPDPHCPHGRPLWKKISKEELFAAVRR